MRISLRCLASRTPEPRRQPTTNRSTSLRLFPRAGHLTHAPNLSLQTRQRESDRKISAQDLNRVGDGKPRRPRTRERVRGKCRSFSLAPQPPRLSCCDSNRPSAYHVFFSFPVRASLCSSYIPRLLLLDLLLPHAYCRISSRTRTHPLFHDLMHGQQQHQDSKKVSFRCIRLSCDSHHIQREHLPFYRYLLASPVTPGVTP